MDYKKVGQSILGIGAGAAITATVYELTKTNVDNEELDQLKEEEIPTLKTKIETITEEKNKLERDGKAMVDAYNKIVPQFNSQLNTIDNLEVKNNSLNQELIIKTNENNELLQQVDTANKAAQTTLQQNRLLLNKNHQLEEQNKSKDTLISQLQSKVSGFKNGNWSLEEFNTYLPIFKREFKRQCTTQTQGFNYLTSWEVADCEEKEPNGATSKQLEEMKWNQMSLREFNAYDKQTWGQWWAKAMEALSLTKSNGR